MLNLIQKQKLIGSLGFLFLIALLIVAWIEGGKERFQDKPEPVITADNKGCVKCHTEKTPVIAAQWSDSKHGRMGVGCLECHAALENDKDSFMHEGKRIATIVTPNDCAKCHSAITQEFMASHHAKAGDILGSLDNVLGEIIEGVPAAANGCQQCHGSKVAFLRDNKGKIIHSDDGIPRFDPTTWPNTGMGRLNLDGSKGSCSACHSRHTFSKKMARQPEVCGKCHMGPDHPQIEIFNESKHGIAFHSQKDEMNLDFEKWVVGEDYSAAPTCATCHMSATKNQPITHDVGKRIAWTLRPVISTKLENADKRRENMKDVCFACHSPAFTRSFFVQYESAIELWNEKFAKPSQSIMAALQKEGKLTPDQFDDKLEWVYFELWHHEGRRARMGASMMGPDYTQWHGFYEVAKHFYTEFLPQAEELAKGTPAEDVIKKVKQSKPHKWLQGLPKEERDKIKNFYKKRYGQTG